MLKKYDLIYFMGDSFTFGVGQAEDTEGEVTFKNRYSQLIATRLNLPHVNKAIAGTNNHDIAHQVYKDLLQYKKDNINPLVVVSWTDPERMSIWYGKEDRPYTISHSVVNFYKDYLLNHHNNDHCYDISRFYIASVKHLIQSLNYDSIETWSLRIVTDPLVDHSREITPSFERLVGDEGVFWFWSDAMKQKVPGHLNVLGHSIMAEKIINKIEELYE